MQSTFCTVFVMSLLRSLSFSLNKFFASRKCFHYCFSIGLISPKLKRKVTPFEMNAEHGKKNGVGDQKNSKGRVPKQAQGNPILTYWQLPPTNKHKRLLHQDAQVLDNQNSSILRIKRQHNHDNNNNNSLRDRRNSTVPGGLVGSPNWRMVRTNMTRFRSFSVLCG